MSKLRTIEIGALNIAMHKPHSPERYVSLFKDAKRLKRLIKLGSLHGAMLGSLSIPKELTRNEVVTGEIYRFVSIDGSLPWFNLETSDAATEDDLENVSIPSNLLPNLQRIEFVFLPYEHQLWLVTQDRKDRMGITTAAKFFQLLFDVLVIEHKYPPIEVTPLPEEDSLEEMLSLKHLEKIVIELKRPNADDGGDLEKKLQKKMEKMNIRKMQTTYTTDTGATISPDEETKEFAKIASKNGNVSIVGRNAEGLPVRESTQAKPMIKSQHVNQEIENSMDVLKRVAKE